MIAITSEIKNTIVVGELSFITASTQVLVCDIYKYETQTERIHHSVEKTFSLVGESLVTKISEAGQNVAPHRIPCHFSDKLKDNSLININGIWLASLYNFIYSIGRLSYFRN
jgi:hypothetical protein